MLTNRNGAQGMGIGWVERGIQYVIITKMFVSSTVY